jgi:pimeloyl-ACP methyl ester carboxylesterase
MSTDRLNQTFILQDGRRLGFAEFGSPTGRPLFHFHGSGSSRLERPALEETLIGLDIRFITVDRPGHGLSDYQPHRCLLDWPDDVGQLADHLGIPRFYVDGHSAGGPHALVCAARFPQRVLAVAAISSVAPMSRPNAYDGMPFLNRFLARSARHSPWITGLARWIMSRMVLGDVEQATRRLMSSIPESDKSVLYAPENVHILVSSIREGFCQGSRGVAHDDILVNRDWGYDLDKVEPRVDIWHGTADVSVPIHAGEYLCAILPTSRATFLPDEGHFFVLRRWEEILSALLEEEY